MQDDAVKERVLHHLDQLQLAADARRAVGLCVWLRVVQLAAVEVVDISAVNVLWTGRGEMAFVSVAVLQVADSLLRRVASSPAPPARRQLALHHARGKVLLLRVHLVAQVLGLRRLLCAVDDAGRHPLRTRSKCALVSAVLDCTAL